MEEMMNSILQGRSTLEKKNEFDVTKWFKSRAESKDSKRMVSPYFQCQTSLTTHLCIDSPVRKLTCDTDQIYKIGGTYDKDKEHFWFFCTSSTCHGNNYLLKLFVIPRKDMQFSIFMPGNGHQRQFLEIDNCIEMTELIKEHTFLSSKKDEILFIKAYSFNKASLHKLGNFILLLPCFIRIYSSYKIHPGIFNKIKLTCTAQLNEELYKTRNDGDFIVESATGKKHHMHTLVAVSHSAVLKDIVRDNKRMFFINQSDEDIEMLIKFLYNGSVDDLSQGKALKLVELAHLLELPGMLKLAQFVLSANINMGNCVQIAMLAKKYNLKQLSFKAFHFIKQNPELLMTESIKRLDDIDLMRDLLQYVGNSGCPCKPGRNIYYMMSNKYIF